MKKSSTAWEYLKDGNPVVMNAKEQTDPIPMAQRQSAKGYLSMLIDRHRTVADGLQVLRDALPDELTPEQDDAIWSIVQSLPRPF